MPQMGRTRTTGAFCPRHPTSRPAPPESRHEPSPQAAEFADREALIGYVGLAAVLTYLSGITVTLPGALGER